MLKGMHLHLIKDVLSNDTKYMDTISYKNFDYICVNTSLVNWFMFVVLVLCQGYY